MKKEILKYVHFRELGPSTNTEHPLYKEDIDKIYELFKSNKTAYKRFRSYCAHYHTEKWQDYPESEFADELMAEINKQIEFGTAFYYHVLEELMKKEGLVVKWSHKDE